MESEQKPKPKLAVQDIYKSPKKTALIGLVLSAISFLVLGNILSIAGAVLGVFAVIGASKQKSGKKVIAIGILAIILGIASYALLAGMTE
ncbi:hypothetical protein L6252_02430 [Candidatus Parcubacteria bacterium]|nr:hypothetical protein [Candidatus Parcubacteria bacterium]